jgi:cytochrome P450
MAGASAPAHALLQARPRTAPLDPSPEYTRLRAEQPVTRVTIWEGRLSPWIVTRYEDARAVLGNPVFSSEVTTPGFPSVFENVLPAPDGFFQNHDDPVHNVMRRSLTREFMIKRIDALRGSIARVTEELLDEMIERGGPLDYVEHFALPLPSLVISELLGVPYKDHDFFQKHSKVFVDLTSTAEQIAGARKALGDYLEDLVKAKRNKPGDDILSRLGQQAADGSEIDIRDAADMAAFVLFAGHETTSNMITLGTITLLQDPARVAQLFVGPAQTATAVEELLRYCAIVHGGLRRIAREDVIIGEVTIRAGEGVIVSLHVANRDPEIFAEPNRFDMRRANARQHVTFGYGIHQCLGQPLARAELQIVLPEVFRRLPDLRITVPLEELAFKQNTMVYGVRELPIAW